VSAPTVTTVATDRLTRTAAAAQDAGVDVLLLTPGADLRYLTGYQAKPLERLTCLVLAASGESALLVPRLEEPAARAAGADRLARLVVHEETDDAYALAGRVVRELHGGDPGVVGLADRMWAEQVLAFRDALPGARQVSAGRVLRPLRSRKDADEIAALARAARAIDEVHAQMGEWLRPGRTERAVARDVADAIVRAGHATVNFVIIGSGPNGASPHHECSDRVIEAGDPVVVDIGGSMPDGYCSDCTRTYVAGDGVDAEFARYYRVLQEAQQAGCEAVRPGRSAEEIDGAARQVITDAGYGEYFVHRTGHGIGIEEHEEPWIVAGNASAVEPGMCFSIEPGIYLPGRHGARIEDIVAVTVDGVERLDTVTRELVVLG
jgi:Xaa-Pro aminopeptidase